LNEKIQDVGSDRRALLRKLVCMAALGGMTGVLMGEQMPKASADLPGSVYFNDGAGGELQNDLFHWDNTNARLGVGTSSPAARLDVNGDILLEHAGTNSGAFMAKDTGGTPRNIMFIGGDNNIYMVNDITNSSYIIQVHQQTKAQFGSPLWLSARGTYTDFFMTSGGNVGIGTASPSDRLDVAGRVKATGYDTGDITFANGIRATEQGKGLAFMNDAGEKIALLDRQGNLYVKGKVIEGLPS
jgi:hypothetical protein